MFECLKHTLNIGIRAFQIYYFHNNIILHVGVTNFFIIQGEILFFMWDNF